jgi:hypothetical protein
MDRSLDDSTGVTNRGVHRLSVVLAASRSKVVFGHVVPFGDGDRE